MTTALFNPHQAIAQGLLPQAGPPPAFMTAAAAQMTAFTSLSLVRNTVCLIGWDSYLPAANEERAKFRSKGASSPGDSPRGTSPAHAASSTPPAPNHATASSRPPADSSAPLATDHTTTTSSGPPADNRSTTSAPPPATNYPATPISTDTEPKAIPLPDLAEILTFSELVRTILIRYPHPMLNRRLGINDIKDLSRSQIKKRMLFVSAKSSDRFISNTNEG